MGNQDSSYGKFISLVAAIESGRTARSENDLSTRLAAVLEQDLGLATVIDSSQRATSSKRPDILAYKDDLDADLVLPAEIVIEAKKPYEIDKYPDLQTALIDGLWEGKTFPYVVVNLSRIRYFIMTSFVQFAILPITEQLRAAFRACARESGTRDANHLRDLVRKNVQTFSLSGVRKTKDQSAQELLDWMQQHLRPEKLTPLPLSSIRLAIPISTKEELEIFATRLAEIAAGVDGGVTTSGIFGSVRSRIPKSYGDLNPETRRDLHLFVMAQRAAENLATAATVIENDPERWLDDFVAASIHSLISRLFALKAIEDAYCIGSKQPLIEKSLWVLNSDEYDDLESDALVRAVNTKIRKLKDSSNSVVQGLAVFGAFFDWIIEYVDPVLFRALMELFVVHDFGTLDGDVLGRFFEMYAQTINSTKRRALGQYYTPLSVVRFMWQLVIRRAIQLGSSTEVTVLDPGMGSATFLSEGVGPLQQLGVRQPWKHIVGFDISPQVMGIAQVNVYMSLLRHTVESRANEIAGLRLYTTDALDPKNGKFLKEIAPLFTDLNHRHFIEKSIEVSASIKQQERFCVVIGNPPYRNNSALTLSQVSERFPNLLKSSDQAARAQERNIRDDYAWFFAAADHYIGKQGLICFITSDSYARIRSYRLFRCELLRNYVIHTIIRLGQHLFQDVGPRIGFVIILMEKRQQCLEYPDPSASFDFVDLSYLSDGVSARLRATGSDPRFGVLDNAFSGELPGTVRHTPDENHGFVLFPVDQDLVHRVLRSSVPAYSRGNERLFVKKWPGLITAFDVLLKGKTQDELHHKVEEFFQIARRNGRNSRRLHGDMQGWAERYGASDEDFERLLFVASSINDKGISFAPEYLKPSVSGTMPNDARWYPAPAYRHWVYYEPRIEIPRNTNPGKNKGWGWMQQWREPESHRIDPKLVFTTTTNPRAGYKAFVLKGEWYVKLHGGTSQQYNYTGLVDPGAAQRLDRGPNNLTNAGEQMLGLLMCEYFSTPDCLLHYIAAIYNSGLANEFLAEESGHDLPIRVPNESQVEVARQLSMQSRQMRDLHRLVFDLPSSPEIPARILHALAGLDVLQFLGMSTKPRKSRGYAVEDVYEIDSGFLGRVDAAIRSGQETIDSLVEDLYSESI